MARWVHADTLDGSLNVIKNNCTKLAVVAVYSAGDSYATGSSTATNKPGSNSSNTWWAVDNGGGSL